MRAGNVHYRRDDPPLVARAGGGPRGRRGERHRGRGNAAHVPGDRGARRDATRGQCDEHRGALAGFARQHVGLSRRACRRASLGDRLRGAECGRRRPGFVAAAPYHAGVVRPDRAVPRSGGDGPVPGAATARAPADRAPRRRGGAVRTLSRGAISGRGVWRLFRGGNRYSHARRAGAHGTHQHPPHERAQELGRDVHQRRGGRHVRGRGDHPLADRAHDGGGRSDRWIRRRAPRPARRPGAGAGRHRRDRPRGVHLASVSSLMMTDKSMEQLRSLLKSYDERAAKLQSDVKPTHDEGERRRRACGDRLRTVVRSVLDRFMDALKNAGHDAAIEDETATAGAYPTVALAFTLTFKCDPRRGVAVARDIKPSPTKGRAVTSSTDRIGTMKVEAVSVEWVETKTLSFIEAVLKVN